MGGPAVLVMGACFALLLQCAHAETYTVGGSSNWTVPAVAGNSQLYTNWVSNKTFKIGDELVFNFVSGQHDVLEVAKPNYDNCMLTNPLAKHETPPVNIILDSTGAHYFTCSVSSHCQSGQKLAITVKAYNAFPTLSPSPSPVKDFSPRSSPSPSPSSSTSSPPPSVSPEKSSQRLAIILGITGSAILGAVSLCIFAMRKKMSSMILKKQIALARDNKSVDVPQKLLFKKEQIVFSLQTLIEATAGFSSTNKLGEGGFGCVYKGVIQDGQEIAVKKLSARSGQGTREFMNEVEIVANIQHRNLVKLIGCCVEGDERLLVYEFLPNKSLDTFLFDPMQNRELDWQKRYNIIAGIARGLLYLHQDSQVRIIHRDIKANNILLDEKLNPKIADFGLARLFADNEIEIQSRVAGTYGYMAPEYAMRGHLSVKADVYSFGVLLLEIVSGRKNTDMKLLNEKQISSLVEWAWILHKQGNILSMVDGAVAETCPEEEASRCIIVGLLCTQADADARPLMSTVVLMISSTREPLPDPKKPAYVSMGQSPTASRNPCTNFTSITVLEPRE